jgi:NCAIR mutase (PurE)-related protein
MPESNFDFILDYERRSRLGFDEAIFCETKTVEQISAIIEDARRHGRGLLLTRLTAAQFAALPEAQENHLLDYDTLSRTAYLGEVRQPERSGQVAIVCAGTSDIAVCREALRTLHYYGVACAEFYDVGVAGLWRLLERIEAIKQFPVVIAVAGMDAALPSVLGGLVAGAIIAVPTSTGYGAAENGRTALNAVLSSCAPGVLVTNIDNGYGAACAALRICNALG